MDYYLITAESAHALNVAKYRKGSKKTGYIVTSGDLVTADDSIRKEAKPVSEKEAMEIIKNIKLWK